MKSRRNRRLVVACASLGLISVSAVTHAQTVTWANSAAATAWYTNTNWAAPTGPADWVPSHIALFLNTGTASTAGINMATAPLGLGAIEMSNLRTRNLTIGNSSTTAGTLTLYGATVNGVSNVVIRNASNSNLTIQNNETGSGKVMDVALANPIENKIVVDGNGQVAISSIIKSSSGFTPLYKEGNGTLALSGANTWSGGLFVNGGSVVLSGSGTLGASTNSVTMSAGTIDLSGTSQTIAALIGSAGTITNTANSNSTLTIGTGDASGTFAGTLTETGSGQRKLGIVKNGTGTQVLTGTNSYSLSTLVTAGTLQFGKTASLYNGTTGSWTAANITVQSGATLALNVGGTGEFTSANVTTIRSIGTASTGLRNGANLGLDTTNAAGGNFVHSAVLTNPNGGANALGIVKLGSNILTLSGNNTYTGPTRVVDGTLRVNGTHTGTGLFTVESGAELGGTGTVAASVQVLAGGMLSPGTSVGTFTIGGGTLAGHASSSADRAELVMEFNAPNNSTLPVSDKLVVTGVGGFSVADATLRLQELGFTSDYFDIGGAGYGVAGISYTLVDQPSGAPVSGPFAALVGGAVLTDLNEGGQFEAFNATWTISYQGGSSMNDIIVTAVPEPTGASIVAIAACALLRRRRRA
jgi:autotransporter-associated beta strand protein